MYCRDQQLRGNGEKYNLRADELDQQDQEELRYFKELLKPFQIVTKRVEGNTKQGSYGAIQEVLLAFDYLFARLAKAKLEIRAHLDIFTDYYKNGINAGFTKLKDYYGKTDVLRVYYAAIVYYPYKRFNYFDDNQKHVLGAKRKIANAKEAVRLYQQCFLNSLPTYDEPDIQRKELRIFNRINEAEDEDQNRFFRRTPSS